jgi:hypothetical protein
MTPDRQFWRCTATLPDGTRCPYPARITVGMHGARLCKGCAFPQGQPATGPAPDGWHGEPADGADD